MCEKYLLALDYHRCKIATQKNDSAVLLKRLQIFNIGSLTISNFLQDRKIVTVIII